MRIIATNDLHEGMVLARSVYDGAGRVVLAKGVSLKRLYIKKLVELGYAYVYVLDPYEKLEDPCVDEPISEWTRIQAVASLKETMDMVRRTGGADLRHISRVVDEIIDEISSNPDVLVSMVDIKGYDNYTYSHSVNVLRPICHAGPGKGTEQV